MTEAPLLLHNPRCSKSRQALALLVDRGVGVEERRYLDTGLDEALVSRILDGSQEPPAAHVRTGEAAFRDTGMGRDELDRDAVVALLVEQPQLLERPVLVVGDRSVIGRPPERVLDLL